MRVIPIIKPQSTFCNLRCEYCFYRETNQEEKVAPMKQSVLEALIRETQTLGDPFVEYDWLGGEPLLAGLDFFHEVVRIQQHYRQNGQVIINKIQSNGVLVDESWVDFFQKNGFQVGISIDGPARCHDRYRKDDKGQGTHQRVLEAIRLLKRAKTVRWGTITVVSRANVESPEEVYRFFLSEGIHKMAFNHVKAFDRHTGSPLEFSPTPEEYVNFMKTLFDFWLADDDPRIDIRQFHSIMQGILGGRYRLCTYAGQCYRFFSIDYNGNVYPCEDDTPTEEICFGNITEGWQAILNSNKYQQHRQLISDIRKECQQCKWYEVCRGGCSRNYRLYIPGVEHKNYLCEAEKSIFEYVFQQMQKVLPDLKLLEQGN